MQLVTADPTAAARPPVMAGTEAVDVAFLGRPAQPDAAAAWQAEIDLLGRAGWRVLQHPEAGKRPATLDAAVVQIADLRCLRGLELARVETQLVLRHVDPAGVRDLPSIARKLGRRLVVAPAHALERLALMRHLPEAWLTLDDWPLLVLDEALHAVADKRPERPLAIGLLAPAAEGHLAPDRLAAALRARGVGGDAINLRAVPPDAVAAFDLEGLDLLIGPPLAGDAGLPFLARRALLAGVALVLSDAWKPVLRASAAFWDWREIVDRLVELAADPGLWQQLFLDIVDRTIERAGEEACLDRLRNGTLGPACPPTIPNPGSASACGPIGTSCDLLIVGDFRRREEASEQLVAQIANHAAAGQRVGLLQVSNGAPGGAIHPGIEASLRQGKAVICAPGGHHQASAVQLVVPRLTVPALDRMRPAIEAEHWHVVEGHATLPDYDPARLHARLERLFGTRPIWHATTQAVRVELAARVPSDPDPWRVPAAPGAGPRQRSRRRPVIGIVAYEPSDAQRALEALAPILVDGERDCRVLLAGDRRTLSLPAGLPAQVLAIDGTDMARFVDGLDLLVVPPDCVPERLPHRAVAESLARGLPVLASPGQALTLRPGPIHLPPAEWPELVRRLRRSKAPPAATRPPEADDLADRLGLPRRTGKRRPLSAVSNRLLFVTANGVGLGHITRLAAIARRLPRRFEPVFATMSQAAGVLEQLGFATELLTTYAGKPGRPWNAATRDRMNAILDYHQPAALILDASNPYQGIMEAAACRNGLKLVWVRRGMWRASQDNSEFLTRAPYFDLVIEPDDIAGQADVFREQPGFEARRVPPIGLLDEAEILDRKAAREALGLPETADGGCVLVQLGSGTTRDLNSLLGRVIDVLQRFQGLEIVLAQWLNAPTEYQGRWPGVRLLSGYPIPRYYRAFDFTISAAGYNSFNDLLRFGLPTIFIANDAECMDDQGARARHAEAAGAAFEIDENDLGPLHDCIQAILQPAVRDYLVERARSLALPNGAAAAARAIARLLS